MARFEEKPVSSTRIRTALEGGDVPAANAMLGMPYAIRFAVQHGAGLGRIGDTWYPSAASTMQPGGPRSISVNEKTPFG